MVLGKDAAAIVQICLLFFFHQPHGFFLLLIPFRLENRFFITYKESYNGYWIFESMQLQVIGIILRSFRFIKDVMVEPFDQIDTFCHSEEIFGHDIAELVIGNVLNIIGCDVGNLSESVIPAQSQSAAIKDSFLFQIGVRPFRRIRSPYRLFSLHCLSPPP